MKRKQFESDMDAELRFHLDAYIDDLVRSGIPRPEAVRRGRLEFGAVEATKDECRQAWGLQWLDELRADLRLTLRTIRRNPGFAAIAILSLALGIGANTAVFGLLDAVLLRTLPVRDAGRLVFVQTAGSVGRDGPPYPYFELLRTQAKSFEAIAAFSPSNLELVIDGAREQARGVWVSGNFYQLLGVAPILGRTLAATDDAAVVISRSFWQQRFAADPVVIGRALHLFDRTVTIVGVLPSETMSLEPGRPIDVAAPMLLSDPALMRDPTSLWLEVVARLKPAVRAEQARAEANTLFAAYMAGVRISPEIRKLLFERLELSPAAQGLGGLRRQFSQPLTAMMILAGLVLLAAVANVANLMLARAAARQKEFAIRLAIGAGRGRLIRQTLTEALVLVGTGAALGIWFARQSETALAAYFGDVVLDLSLNGRMLLFTLTVAVLSGLAFGILPALRASRSGLHASTRGTAGSRGSQRLGRALVITQVALSTVLLGGAGLFLHSLRQLESVDLGFTREGLLTMEVAPERELFGSAQWSAEQSEILDRVRRIPGVRRAAWATMNPMSGRDRGVVLDIPGFTPRAETDKHAHLAALSPDYFETLGIPLLLGRAFTVRDDAAAPKVAILNETAARFYFGDANPIGRKLTLTNYAKRDLTFEIVGVAKAVKHDSLREQPPRFVYLPIPQSADRINRLALSVRTADASAVTREIHAVRSTLLITNVSTLEKQVNHYLRSEQLVTILSTAFGALALVLACIGLYGILAYAVSRRTSEIGIRMALGATKADMVRLILREAAFLATGGILFGVPAVFFLGRISRALLYEVGQFDLPAFAAALLLLLLAAAAAAIVPARRAGKLDPISALRCE
jgi:predicted permease